MKKLSSNQLTAKRLNTIFSVIYSGNGEWSEIAKAITDKGLAPRGKENWLHIRNLLQCLLNRKYIYRLNDVNIEMYLVNADDEISFNGIALTVLDFCKDIADSTYER